MEKWQQQEQRTRRSGIAETESLTGSSAEIEEKGNARQERTKSMGRQQYERSEAEGKVNREKTEKMTATPMPSVSPSFRVLPVCRFAANSSMKRPRTPPPPPVPTWLASLRQHRIHLGWIEGRACWKREAVPAHHCPPSSFLPVPSVLSLFPVFSPDSVPHDYRTGLPLPTSNSSGMNRRSRVLEERSSSCPSQAR